MHTFRQSEAPSSVAKGRGPDGVFKGVHTPVLSNRGDVKIIVAELDTLHHIFKQMTLSLDITVKWKPEVIFYPKGNWKKKNVLSSVRH